MSPATGRTTAARDRQQTFGATWWSKRWIRALESLGATYPNTRLPRGRSLARNGAVQGLQVQPGEVTARVEQGGRTYQVALCLPVFTEEQWQAGVRALAGQIQHAASLLQGQMPENIDETFGKAGFTLFPRRGEFSSRCGCRDTGDPCVHGAAVHYTFAGALDDNPFLLPALRGHNREELLARLRAARSGSSVQPSAATDRLPVDEAFFAGGDLAQVPLHPLPPSAPDHLIRRLGPPPAGEPGDTEALAALARRAAAYAWEVLRAEEARRSGSGSGS
ncbi:hypothetical protein ACFQ9Z_18155 [Streptomyces sp. NPDC056580]|uniref:SWIM zinc finger family protein n=1 Tax=Streptomyces sp. NPDC056580 TaxID=3345872 RepID=UPI0036982023